MDTVDANAVPIDGPNTAEGELAEYAVEQLALEQKARLRACKICRSPSSRFDMLDFEKFVSPTPFTRSLSCVPVIYWRCSQCRFIFTAFFDRFTPSLWSRHVYNDQYHVVDGEFAEIRPSLDAKAVQSYFPDLKDTAIGLDFGGGHGRTAQLLRDSGWTYDCHDPFGVDELQPERIGRYNLCTAFEVLEHLPDPVASLRTLLTNATPGPLILLVGTAVTDGSVSEATRLAWSYAGPRNGHISLFSRRSLEVLADQLGLLYTSCSPSTHALSRGHDPRALRRRLWRGRIRLLLRRKLSR